MDDLHRESIFHPAASILPAVFAAGEKEHVSGRTLILGILTGYEVGIRAALAAGKSHYEYWHTTATCGTFGAAAGAARVIGLETEPFVWAIGSAGTQSAGLWEFLTDGAMSKQLHPGKSSMNGLLSALLAMLNTCVPGITVVNIDNGLGAGVAAAMINRLGEADETARGVAAKA